jgi:hypothetical protein
MRICINNASGSALFNQVPKVENICPTAALRLQNALLARHKLPCKHADSLARQLSYADPEITVQCHGLIPSRWTNVAA